MRHLYIARGRIIVFWIFGTYAVATLILAALCAYLGYTRAAWLFLGMDLAILFAMSLQIPALGGAVLPLPVHAIHNLPDLHHQYFSKAWFKAASQKGLAPSVLFRHRFLNPEGNTCLHCGAPRLHAIHLPDITHVES